MDEWSNIRVCPCFTHQLAELEDVECYCMYRYSNLYSPMWAFTGYCDLRMKPSLEHVSTYLIWLQKFTFILYCTKEANGISKAANLFWSLQLYFLEIYCPYHLTEQTFGDVRACLSIGWFNAVLDWPVTSLKITSDSPLLQWEPKGYKNVVFVVFFLTFVVLLGNSRTSTVFSLLLLLEIRQRNISIKYA